MSKLGRVILAAVLLVLATAFLGCGRNVPVFTPEQIADNYANFFSVLHDRDDIKEGTFQLYPWINDTFEIKSDSRPVVKQEDKTYKELGDNKSKLTVETKTYYSLVEAPISAVMTRDIRVKRWVNRYEQETISQPVKLQIVGTEKPIEAGTFKGLSGLGEEWHTYRVQIPERARGRFYEKLYCEARSMGGGQIKIPVDSLNDPYEITSSNYTRATFVLLVKILEVDGIEVK